MKKLLILFLTLASLYGYAQVPSLNDIVRTNTLSPSKVSNALDGSKSFTATGTDAYAITTNLGQYSGVLTYAVGDMYTVTFTNANTSTTVTLNVDGEGVVSIKDNAGNNPAIGDLKAGGTYKVRFNGTNFRIVGASGSSGGTVTDVTGTTDRITSTGGATPVIDIASAYDDFVDGKVADVITNGITTIAPSQNAVYDALALKQNDLGTQSANLVYSGPASGAAATPTFRRLTAEDLATLTTSRTVTSGSASVQTDNLRKVYLNSAGSNNMVIDLLAVGTEITFINIGAGTWTLTQGSGVTLPGGSVTVASGANAIVNYRVPATPDVYTGVVTNTFVDMETPSGTINGSNTAFTIANTPISGSVHVYLNGLLQKGGGSDYSISGTTITFVTAPETGSTILTSYRK